MKRFNLAVAALIAAIYGISTTPVEPSENATKFEQVRANVIYQINDTFERYVSQAALIDSGGIVNFESSEATQIFLRESFWRICCWLFAVNLAFYAGNGTFRRWGTNITHRLHVQYRVRRRQWHRKPPAVTTEKVEVIRKSPTGWPYKLIPAREWLKQS